MASADEDAEKPPDRLLPRKGTDYSGSDEEAEDEDRFRFHYRYRLVTRMEGDGRFAKGRLMSTRVDWRHPT